VRDLRLAAVARELVQRVSHRRPERRVVESLSARRRSRRSSAGGGRPAQVVQRGEQLAACEVRLQREVTSVHGSAVSTRRPRTQRVGDAAATESAGSCRLHRVTAELVTERRDHLGAERLRLPRPEAGQQDSVITGAGTSSASLLPPSSGPRPILRTLIVVRSASFSKARAAARWPGAHPRSVVPQVGDVAQI